MKQANGASGSEASGSEATVSQGEASGRYTHARHYFHYDYAEGEALPASTAEPKQRARANVWPGLALTLALTLAAMWLSEVPVWPFTLGSGEGARHPIEPVMLAIIFGMLVGNSWKLPAKLSGGIKFAVKQLLPVGIVLLGARLQFGDIVAVGAPALLLSVVELGAALALMWFFTRRFGLGHKLGTLLGVGTAICGGTAIVAMAPVIEAEEKDVAFSVATVTLLGLISMFALPVIAHLMGMSAGAFGVWAGLAIHQTPQVVAAGFAFSPEAGEVATVVKLTRVCLLAPVVFGVGVMYARARARELDASLDSRGEDANRHKINYWKMFPTFVLGFLGLAILRSLGMLPDVTMRFSEGLLARVGAHNIGTAALFESGARFFIVMSMAGVGLETKFAAMKQTGMKPFLCGTAAALLITVALGAVITGLGIG